jgi:hypothetical protein
MASSIHDYLRLLDIDVHGDFVRLINNSRRRPVNLSDVTIRQVTSATSNEHEQSVQVNSYRFPHRIDTLLPAGDCVTIYANENCHVQFEMKPYVFIASTVARWSTSDASRTEISIDQDVFDRCQPCSLSCDNDVPLLFNNRIRPWVSSCMRREYCPTIDNGRCRFPYCLSTEHPVNPHTSGMFDCDLIESDTNTREHVARTMTNFDAYARRLTSISADVRLPTKHRHRMHFTLMNER